MAMKIRAWLRNSTNSTLVMPASPPAAISTVATRSDRAVLGCRPSARKATAIGALMSMFGIGHHAGDHRRHGDIEHRAEQQRDEDADGHVALRIAGLFGVRRDRVEADVGEEDDRRPEHDARQAVGHEGRAGGVVDRQQPAVQPDQAQHAPGVGRLSLASARTSGSNSLPRPADRLRLRAGRPRSRWRRRRSSRPPRAAESRPAFCSRCGLLLGPFDDDRPPPICFVKRRMPRVSARCVARQVVLDQVRASPAPAGSTRCDTGIASNWPDRRRPSPRR